MENRDWTAELQERIAAHIDELAERAASMGDTNLEPTLSRIMADIEVFGVLKAREGYEECRRQARTSRGYNDVSGVEFTFPLPTRTRQVLREEPDPSGSLAEWRWNGRLEYRPNAGRSWFALGADEGEGRVFAPHPERIDLWHSLKHQPFRTEQLPADENNPWPDEAP